MSASQPGFANGRADRPPDASSAPGAARVDTEESIYAGPSSQWSNAGTFFTCAVAAGVGVAVRVFGVPKPVTWVFVIPAVLIAVAVWLRVRFTIYRVTTYRIEVERGWLTKSVQNLDLFRIKDVSLRIGLIERLIGVGDVTITSSDADTPVQTLSGIPQPRAIYEHLKHAALEAARRRDVVRVES